MIDAFRWIFSGYVKFKIDIVPILTLYTIYRFILIHCKRIVRKKRGKEKRYFNFLFS